MESRVAVIGIIIENQESVQALNDILHGRSDDGSLPGGKRRQKPDTDQRMGVRLLSVKQTASVISIYAADVSGVASALFELGGMTGDV